MTKFALAIAAFGLIALSGCFSSSTYEEKTPADSASSSSAPAATPNP